MAIAALLAIGIGVAVYLASGDNKQVVTESQNGSADNPTSAEHAKTRSPKTNRMPPPTTDDNSAPVTKPATSDHSSHATVAGERSGDGNSPAPKNPHSSRPPKRPRPKPIKKPGLQPPRTQPQTTSPFADIRKRDGVLVLPNLELDGLQEKPAAALAKVYVKTAADLKLQLLGTDVLADAAYNVGLRRDDATDASKWTVIQTKKERPSFALSSDSEREIALFELSGESLLFQWKCSKRPAVRLASCLLKLTVDRKSVVCPLSKPVGFKPVAIEFPEQASQVALPIAAGVLPEPSLLRVDLRLDSFPDHQVQGPLTGMRPGETSVIHFEGQDLQKHLLEIRIQLRWHDTKAQPSFIIERFAFPIDLADSKGRSPALLLTDSDSRTVRTSHAMVNPSVLLTRSEEYLTKFERDRQRLSAQQTGIQRTLEKLESGLESYNSGLESVDENIKQYTRYMHQNPTQRNYYLERVQRYTVERAQMLQQIESVKRQIEQVKKQLPREFQIKEFVEDNLRYARQLTPLVTSLKSNAQIHFDAYVELENERVVLVTTQQAEGQADDSNESLTGSPLVPTSRVNLP